MYVFNYNITSFVELVIPIVLGGNINVIFIFTTEKFRENFVSFVIFDRSSKSFVFRTYLEIR